MERFIGFMFQNAVVYIYIRAFHLGREQFLAVPGPPELGLRKLEHYPCPTLGALGGCLSLQCALESSQHLEIWVLKGFRTRDFVIDISLFDRYNFFRPIMITDGGDVLIFISNNNIVLYSPSWQTFRPLNGVYDIESPFNAVAHVLSFISLNDVAVGEKLKVIHRECTKADLEDFGMQSKTPHESRFD